MKKFLIFYFLFSLSFFAFFSSGFVDSQDGFQYLAVARRIYFDHTFEMPTEEFPDKNIHMSLTKGSDGKIYSPTGLGYSLALLPAVAGEDIFLHLSNTQPISAFPLQSDWPVLLFASMTNAFFGALLVVTLYLFIKSYGISHKTSVLLSFLGVIGTNLWPYTRYTFAHMMFVTFLTLSFYLIRRYSISKKPLNLTLVGITFGIVVISYNPTYNLAVIPLAAYYLLLLKFKFSINSLKTLLRDLLLGLVGLLPFYALYIWFNAIRTGDVITGGYGGTTITRILPLQDLFEGIWGVLLSPGKSIFLFSPVLLILFLFWFKIKKEILPEVISFSILTLTYIYVIGTNYYWLAGVPVFAVWHGDSSYGPRYMLAILPLWIIVIANIYNNLSKKAKLFVFYPLIIIGILIQLPGILLPYQIKFAGLQQDNFLNGRNFNVYEYGNEIPRYSPVLSMSKTLVKRLRNAPHSYNHGIYNMQLLDGFDYPFDLGWAKWRGVNPTAVVSFDQNNQNPVKELGLQFRNHQITPQSSSSARISVSLNGGKTQDLIIPVNQEEDVTVTADNLKDKNNLLTIKTDYIGTSSAMLKKKQVIFLQIFRINRVAQNIETLDYPYVSPISKSLLNINYHYWGGEEKDPWQIWYMHSGVYEQTFDLWWLRPFTYWDLQKKFFLTLFGLNILGFIFFGYKSLKSVK